MESLNGLKWKFNRIYLIRELIALSDRDYQREAWLGVASPDNLSLSINFLDDFGYFRDSKGSIGLTLWDEEEAECVEAVCKAITSVAEVVGWEAEDVVWLDCPLWENVLRSARTARELLLSNDHKRAIAEHSDDG